MLRHSTIEHNKSKQSKTHFNTNACMQMKCANTNSYDLYTVSWCYNVMSPPYSYMQTALPTSEVEGALVSELRMATKAPTTIGFGIYNSHYSCVHKNFVTMRMGHDFEDQRLLGDINEGRLEHLVE